MMGAARAPSAGTKDRGGVGRAGMGIGTGGHTNGAARARRDA